MNMADKSDLSRQAPFLADRKKGLHYSLYLVIGTVSLFSALVALNNTYQGYIWSYSQRYIINSFTLAFALFLAGALLIIACVRLVQAKPAHVFGFAGLGFLLAYSLFVLFIDRYIAYTLVFMVILLVLFALILAIAVLIFRNKRR
jgi:peptidoglycan/LPS O-acetylase OafA/YrhL